MGTIYRCERGPLSMNRLVESFGLRLPLTGQKRVANGEERLGSRHPRAGIVCDNTETMAVRRTAPYNECG